MRRHTPHALLLAATACRPGTPPQSEPDTIAVGTASCIFGYKDEPQRMQVDANNELRLKLLGPYPAYDNPVGYDWAGEPYPEFHIQTLMMRVGEDRRVPSHQEVPAVDGWSDETPRELPNDEYFRRAVDIVPPDPGAWVLYVRAEIPGVTDYANLCHFTERATRGEWWEPEPPVDGWSPGRMIWIEAE